MCAYCKSIRNDENYWQTLEGYLAKHTNAQLTHGVCPTCYDKLLKPQLEKAAKPKAIVDAPVSQIGSIPESKRSQET